MANYYEQCRSNYVKVKDKERSGRSWTASAAR